MRIAPKRVSCISVIYNKLLYAYVPHTYATVTNGLQLDIPDILINILQGFNGQSSHFQVLIGFLKRAREAASRISIGTCCQSWVAQYGIVSSTYFNERRLSVWKMWKFQRLYIFSLNLKISFIMTGECPFRYLKTSIIREFIYRW